MTLLPLASGSFLPLAPSGRSAIWAVTGRLGGLSGGVFSGANLADHVGDQHEHVESNRSSLAEIVGIQSTDLAIMEQVHGGRVATVRSAGKVDSADALVTEVTGIGLVALGADCATVGICGSRSNGELLIAALHCGWLGLCADILGNTLREMSQQGAVTFRAILGPAICGDCYQVPAERVHQVRDSCQEVIAVAALDKPGGIDVGLGLRAQLTEWGIPHESLGDCTAESRQELFSFRRDGRTGRQGLALALKGSAHG